MSILMDMTKAYLDSKGFRYQAQDDKEVIRTGLSGLKNKGSVDILLIFQGNSVSIRSFRLFSVPEEKKDKIYEVCSDMNSKFRWVKFYVDDEDNTVTVADDAILLPESAGAEVFELMMRMAGIIDQAYPELMKALWA